MFKAMGFQVHASIHYHNSAQALSWLVENLGFKVLSVVYGPEGRDGEKAVHHAELSLGGCVIFLGQKPPNTLASFGLYVSADEAQLLELYSNLQKKGEPALSVRCRHLVSRAGQF